MSLRRTVLSKNYTFSKHEYLKKIFYFELVPRVLVIFLKILILIQPLEEWKFARSKLWLTYFEDDSSPLPPPFNIVPSLEPLYDLVMYLIGWKKNLNEIPVDRNGISG